MRATSRHVAWLTSLLQSASAHHSGSLTSPLAQQAAEDERAASARRTRQKEQKLEKEQSEEKVSIMQILSDMAARIAELEGQLAAVRAAAAAVTTGDNEQTTAEPEQPIAAASMGSTAGDHLHLFMKVVFYVGERYVFPSGDKLVYGMQGRVTGALERDHVTVLFNGNKDTVSVRPDSLSTSAPGLPETGPSMDWAEERSAANMASTNERSTWRDSIWQDSAWRGPTWRSSTWRKGRETSGKDRRS